MSYLESHSLSNQVRNCLQGLIVSIYDPIIFQIRYLYVGHLCDLLAQLQENKRLKIRPIVGIYKSLPDT
jgi:hypothetical protein